ncbi:hypothetical protein KGQ34_00105 [Patescibacteria group bacterium]|nr:hypothetical protein [Patescibacteria group bacterium]
MRISIFIAAILFVAFFSFPHNANAASCTGSPPACSQSGVPINQCNVPVCVQIPPYYQQAMWGCFTVQGSCGGGGGGGGGGFSWNVSASANPNSGTVPLNGVSFTGTFNFSGLTAATITSLTYEFDCNGDGVFEQTYTQTSGFGNSIYSHTVSCNYPQSGHYQPLFRGSYVFSNGDARSAVTQTYVNVAPGNPNVSLSANPSSGQVPLNGVSLTANISNATDIKNYYSSVGITETRYYFYCVNGGPTSLSKEVFGDVPASYTATSLCNYASSGTYQPKVQLDVILNNGTILSGFANTAVTASFDQLPIGSHDGADNTSCTTSGWADDPDTPATHLTVKLYSDGALATTVVADQPRADLTGVCPSGACSFNASLSGFISTGVTHSITATAIDAQTGQEVNLANTPKSITCPTVSSLPDLIISSGPSLNSGTLVAGSTLTFKETVKNQGTATASGTFNNRFRVDTDNDGVIDASDPDVTPYPTITNLAAGASQQVISGSWTAVAGTYRLYGCADRPGNLIAESDETNNCSWGDTLTVAPMSFGTIQYRATKDGVAWDSPPFTVSMRNPAGVTSEMSIDPPYDNTSAPTGSYAVQSVFPPAGVEFKDINGSSLSYVAPTLLSGGTLTLTFDFTTVSSQQTPNVIGYAWAGSGANDGTQTNPGIGWVSMSSLLCDPDSDGLTELSSPACPPVNTAIPLYGVSVSSSGALSGWAWANPNDGFQNHIGWISFNAADVAGCPTAPCAPTLDRTNGHLTGWARALSYNENGQTGGWDGWIRLWNDSNGNNIVNTDAASPTDYGVTVNGCGWSGYAWGGGTDIGWIHFRHDANNNGIVNTENNGDYGVNGTGNGCTTIGAIAVSATLNGFAWPSSGAASVNYSFSGPTAISSFNSVPATYSNLADGSYSLTYVSGGPAGATLTSISPCAAGVNPCSQSISGGTPIAFTLNFNAAPPPPGSVFMTVTPQNACKVIDVFWGSSSGAAGYNVQRCGDANCSLSVPTPVCSVTAPAPPATACADSSAPDGTPLWYRVNAYNAFGTSAWSYSASSITNNAPNVSFSYTPSSNIRVGQLVAFSGALINGNATTSQSWAFAGGTPSSSTSASPSASFATAGSHTVTYTANNASGSCVVSNPVSVSQNPFGDWCELPPDAWPGTACP